MPQPAGQNFGTPFRQGEAKLKRFPLFLGIIGWILVICSFLFPYLITQEASKSGHPEGAGWVWILILFMWVGLIGPMNILGVVLSFPSRAVQVSAPQRTLNVWAIVLNVSSLALGILGFVGLFFIAG